MKFLAVLVLASVVAAATSSQVCESNRGENLIQFNNRNQDVFFPCKYWALRRQQCGKYQITLSPGNRWLYPKYQLDTIWLGVNNTESGEYWEGRTSNKLAAKYLNSRGETHLYNQRDGSIATSQDFEFGNEGTGVYIQDKASTFRVTFIPFDPNNRKDFPNSDWKYECFDNSSKLNEYPDQLCGGSEKRAVLDRTKEVFDLPDRFRENVIYFDTFTDKEIAHTNPKCTDATDILLNTCQDDAQRLNAINNCKVILHSKRHTQCVTNYVCDPMDVFNACILWGCTGSGFDRHEKELCLETAIGIDFCPNFANSGNLTARVEDANCYKEFLAIEA